VYIGIFRVHSAVLGVYRALLSVYRALLSVRMAPSILNRALLCVCGGLF